MKIAAKGMIDPAYFAYGRKWPRHDVLEVEVSAQEYAQISADKNIVCVAIPDPVAEPSKRSKGA